MTLDSRFHGNDIALRLPRLRLQRMARNDTLTPRLRRTGGTMRLPRLRLRRMARNDTLTPRLQRAGTSMKVSHQVRTQRTPRDESPGVQIKNPDFVRAGIQIIDVLCLYCKNGT